MKTLRNVILILITIQLSSCDNIKQRIQFIKHKEHIDFIKANPDNIESAHTLAVMATTFGIEKTKELFDLLADSVKNSENGLLVSKYLDLFKNPQIGDRYTDFLMKNQNGETLRLSDLEGKIILLEFWATWCKGCFYQLPDLTKTYDKFHDKDFEIFAISYDEDKERWIKTIEEKKLNWIHVSELKSIGNTAGLIYGVSSIPDNFLINKDGIIVARDLKGEELDEEIAKLINN